MIKLFNDKRDLSFHTYGQTTNFPTEFNPEADTKDDVQPIGNVECSCYTICDIAKDDTGTTFDIDDLFKRIPHDANGADPRDALGEMVKNGLLPIGKLARIRPYSSYFSAHTGNLSPFDNMRSALLLAGYPVAIWSEWYAEWNNQTILPKGVYPVSGHMYVCEGWKAIDGEIYLIIEAWLGHKMYMSEEVFNDLVSKFIGTAVLSNIVLQKKSILQQIRDALISLVGLYQDLLAKKKLQ